MPSITLTDLADRHLSRFRRDRGLAGRLGLVSEHAWSVTKRTLRGGRRDGVDLIVVDNGALSLWRSSRPEGWASGEGALPGEVSRGRPLGWTSPVVDGPVNPSFVHLADRGGLGWLDGFDELMVRCGLANNGGTLRNLDRALDGSTARSGSTAGSRTSRRITSRSMSTTPRRTRSPSRGGSPSRPSSTPRSR